MLGNIFKGPREDRRIDCAVLIAKIRIRASHGIVLVRQHAVGEENGILPTSVGGGLLNRYRPK